MRSRWAATTARRALWAMGAVLAGCVNPPDVGPPLRPACSAAPANPDHVVRFQTDIRDAIFLREDLCVRCHTATGKTPIGLAVSGLELSSYARLRAGGALGGTNTVVPGDPCASVLIQKLGPAPPFGGRMPLDGPYLTTEELQTIVDWIAAGALDD
ncbi:MAG: hypothetical protein ABIY55_04895 [Kofleriaceae bacterium]